MKILHISESLGGGVLKTIATLTSAQVAAGHQVLLAHSVRHDTPARLELNSIIAPAVVRQVLPMSSTVSPWKDSVSLFTLIRFIRKEKPDVIHAHSSKAGILARLASKLTGSSRRVLYSPHCYSFLRQDVSRFSRYMFYMFERIGVILGGHIVACGQTESFLSKYVLRHPRVFLVENAVPISAFRIARSRIETNTVKLGSAGRICKQKGPEIFADLCEKLTGLEIDCVWIGDGPLRMDFFPSEMPVMVTGWMSPENAVMEMESLDIFVMTSKWEGMPLTLIESQLMGIPCVVPDVPGCVDVVLHGINGYVYRTSEELESFVRTLVSDAGLRTTIGSRARELALSRFSEQRFIEGIEQCYLRVTEPADRQFVIKG